MSEENKSLIKKEEKKYIEWENKFDLSMLDRAYFKLFFKSILKILIYFLIIIFWLSNFFSVINDKIPEILTDKNQAIKINKVNEILNKVYEWKLQSIDFQSQLFFYFLK